MTALLLEAGASEGDADELGLAADAGLSADALELRAQRRFAHAGVAADFLDAPAESEGGDDARLRRGESMEVAHARGDRCGIAAWEGDGDQHERRLPCRGNGMRGGQRADGNLARR